MNERYILSSKNNRNKILRSGEKILGYNIPNTAIAVYSEDDNSLTFYYWIIPEEGDSYNGKTVTNVYTGFETETWSSASSAPWYSLGTSIKTVVIDNSFKNVQPVSLAYWFYGMTNVTFEGLENIDTSKVTTLQYIFENCNSLTNVDDLSGWDTSKVTTLQSTFYNCSNLVNVDGLNGWNTSNVTTLQYTFRNCSSLTSIDISDWDTAKATNMQGMFNSCSSLETIYSDDSNFVTSAITLGGGMFTNCSKLVGGNGTAYSSSNVTYVMAHVDTTSNPGYFTAK